jgi:NADH-quinone oxidoreductase subunit H
MWTVTKTLGVIVVLVGCGRRLPAIRADRYVELSWVVLLPVSVLQVLVAALVVLNR